MAAPAYPGDFGKVIADLRAQIDALWRRTPGVTSGGGGGGGSRTTETQTAIADITLSGHRAVTPQSDGTLIYADNATIAHANQPLWVTTGATSGGLTATVVSHGTLTEPTWSWSSGLVFLGADGALTQTPPALPGALFQAVVGMAVNATTLFVDRQTSIVL